MHLKIFADDQSKRGCISCLDMSSRSTSIPHHTSISSNTSSQQSQSQSQAQIQQGGHQQPQTLTAQQLAERVISPASVLFQGNSAPPPPRTNVQERRSYTDMDRRHPSSFQQLEKVWCFFPARRNRSNSNTGHSWAKGHMPPSTKAGIDRLANS